jgi:para-aminobenzoate synthetase/4-amino-4-deoxychorismate lyase
LQIFNAMFPCASITGAPKRRTMEIIAELETSPRGLYTGAIGWMDPAPAGGPPAACFNVAIRTVWLDRKTGKAEYGTGSGVVWDSEPAREYEECLLKSRLLFEIPPVFQWLETLRWESSNGWKFLDGHFQRLEKSMAYFSNHWKPDAVREALNQAVAGKTCDQRVRLLVDASGFPSVETAPLPLPACWSKEDNPPAVRAALALTPVQTGNLFLYHKTTRRSAYEQALKERPGCDDVILWNEREELTESATANLVLLMNGKRLTPPVASGLLDGVYRQQLLKEAVLEERVLRKQDLASASAVYLINSVRGWRKVVVL